MLLTAFMILSNKDLHMKILNGDHLIMLLSNRVSVGRNICLYCMHCGAGYKTASPYIRSRGESGSGCTFVKSDGS